MKNIESNIKIIVGSWGSYNACNSRALGSTWLDLSNFTDWDDIEEELKKQGFQLNGIDAELFVQDVEGLPSNTCNWDYMSPHRLFKILSDSEIMTDEYKHEVMQAFLEVKDFSDFEKLVDSCGSHWDDDIHLYHNCDWDDYGRDYYINSNGEISEDIDRYFDFESYGQDIGYDTAYKYSKGIIEIY